MAADFLIFDFETLSSKASEAPIISMGAIAGNWKDMDTIETLRESGFYRNVDAIEQISKYGLKTTKETLAWWEKQGENAKKVLQAKDKVSLEQCMNDFAKWCTERKVTHQNTMVYIRAPHFDFTIYENLLDKLDIIYRPFSHWKVRDTRTFVDIAYGQTNGYIPGFKASMDSLGLTEHNALDDCIKEYLQLKDYYQMNL